MVATMRPSLNNPTTSYTKKLPEADTAFVLDFFSGCGGMSWGFANTRQSHHGFQVLAGIDIDDKALATYAANITAPAIHQDIRLLAADPERLRELVPHFDPQLCRPLVFIGCPPCQGFSAHRKKDDRDDPRNSLLMCFAQLCEYFRPDVIVTENVPEILKGRFQHYYEVAARSLERSGYSLTQDVLDLSLYGVPQRRRRAVVIGTLRGKIDLPQPVFSRETALTVRHAISHLTPIASGETDPIDPFHKAPAHTSEILERIRRTPADGGDRRALPAEDQLECHQNLDTGSSPGFTDVYGRLRWDAPSVTITAKSSTPSCGRFLHPEQDRNISVREAAILQGFPQSFVFEGPFVNQYRQIGEAVPPLFARFVAWQVLDHLFPKQRTTYAPNAVFTNGFHQGMREPIWVVDAFCGAGGISLGFEKAGFQTAFAFDLDADAVATFARNISPAVRQADVCDRDLPDTINNDIAGLPFVVVGGPPCQGFSQQRRGIDNDPRNNLVLRYAQLIRALEHRPLAVVLENVTYLDSPRGKEVLAEYMQILQDIQYCTFRHDLNCADYGTPQLRRRIVVVALPEPIASAYRGPLPFTGERWPSVGEILSQLPDPAHPLFGITLANHEPSREGDENKRRIAYVDMGKGRMAIPPELQLECHTKYKGHLDVYGRLDWFSQARTITAGFDSFTRGEFAHPFQHRSITAREAALIQGFPNEFAFLGNRASVRHQIGNAVPPPMAVALANAILTAIQQAGEIG